MRVLTKLAFVFLLLVAMSPNSALGITQYEVTISTSASCAGTSGSHSLEQCYGAQGAHIYLLASEANTRYHLQIYNSVTLTWVDVGAWKIPTPPNCVDFGVVNVDGTYRVVAQTITPPSGSVDMLNTVVLLTDPMFVPGTANNPNDTICYGHSVGLPLTATPATGGGNPISRTYTWQSCTDNLHYTDIPGTTTTAPANYAIPGIMTITTYYRVKEIDVTCGELRYTAPTTVFVYDELFAGLAYNLDGLPSPTIEEWQCPGGSFYMIIAEPPDGGSGIDTYQWQIRYDTDPPNVWTDLPFETLNTVDPNIYMTDVDAHFRCLEYDTYCMETVITNVVNKNYYTPAVSTICCDQEICYADQADFLHASNPTGGSGVYAFQWQMSTDGGTTWLVANETPNNLLDYSPGVLYQTTKYRIQIHDQVCNNEGLSNVVTISVGGYMDAYFQYGDITCNGICDGYIYFFDPTGGFDGYEFSIDGGVTWSSDTYYSGLCPDSYELWMRDPTHPSCMVGGRIVVLTQPEGLTADITFSKVTCANTCDGTITISNPQGGWDGYEFRVEGPYTSGWTSSMYFTGLCTGYYDIWIRDAQHQNCEVYLGYVYIPAPDPLFTFYTYSDITCFDACDGTITFYGASGGWDGYEYSINGGETWSSSGEFTGLCPGYYSLIMRDAQNPECFTQAVRIKLNAPEELFAEVITTHVTCWNTCDGTINITNPAGGWDGFEFDVEGPGLTGWTGSTYFSGLCTGYYDIWMRDAANPNCSVYLGEYFIPQPEPLHGYIYLTDVTCNGTCDGTIYFYDPTGGWDGYEWTIDGGATWSANTYYTGLCAGDYIVGIRDASNPDCAGWGEFTIYSPFELDADVDYTRVTCYNTCDGTITISNATGGWDGFEFSINDGGTWSSSMYYTGLCAGTYKVWMRDAQNPTCTMFLEEIEILQPGQMDSYYDWTNVTCFGSCDGTISFFGAYGGWDGYDFSIDGGVTWSSDTYYSGLCPGDYSLWMRDAENPNCIVGGALVVIWAPNPLDAEVQFTNVTCAGSCDGTISIYDPQGGYGTYEFSIDGGLTWSSSMYYTGLCQGWYEIYIRDYTYPACSSWLEDIYIEAPAEMNAYYNYLNVTCYGSCDGEIHFFDPWGGWDGYEFSIDNGVTWSSNMDYYELCPGFYPLKMRDASNPNCVVGSAVVEILQPGQLTAQVSYTDVTCANTCDGTITITDPQGGWDGYEYLVFGGNNGMFVWDGQSTYTGLCPGWYEIWMRDASNPDCMVYLGSVQIEAPLPLGAFVYTTNQTCSYTCDGTISFSGSSGGWDGYEFTIDGGLTWSSDTYFTGLCEDYYIIGMRDAANPNCTVWGEVLIYGPEPLNAYVDWTNVTCNNWDVDACDGTISISLPTGGWDGYEFSIDGGTTWSSDTYYTGLCAGNYDVWMRDASVPVCTKFLGTIEIEKPDGLWSIVNWTNETCYQACDGTIIFSDPTGGWDGYEFSINGGLDWSSNMTYTGLCPGEYFIMMRDAQNTNCYLEGLVYIYGPDPLTATVTTTNTCENKCDGTITISDPSGGWDGYEFLIEQGGVDQTEFWSSDMVYTGLCAGIYYVWMRDASNPDCIMYLGYYFINAVPAPLFHIEGPNPVCQYQSGDVYSVVWDYPPMFNVTYQWVVTDNGDGLTTWTGNNSPQIVVHWGNGTAGQVSCLVTYTNEYLEWGINCSTCVILPITINPLPDPHIIGCSTVVVGDICCFEVENIPGYLYNWTVNCGEILDCGCGYRTCVHWLTPGTCTISVCVTNLATGCTGCTTFVVTVNPGVTTLDGYITYNNTYNSPLDGVTVQLKNTSGAVVASTLSGVNINDATMGYYLFENLAPGTYNLNALMTGNWGGVNATDALIDQLVFLGLYTFTPFDYIIGNVNADAQVNPTDALWIKMRSIGMINYFPAGDWKFNNLPTITVSSTPGTTHYDFKGACVGDVNYSDIPVGLKAISTIGIINDGMVTVSKDESFDYTIRLSKPVELGAITLFLNYNTDLVEVESVASAPDGAKYVLENGMLNLAWSDTKSLSLSDNEAVITLRMKAKVENAEASQMFSVNAGSELADPKAGIIGNVDLKMGSISSMPAGEFSLTNFPNPFRNSTTISYVLPEQGHVKLVITNMYGEMISSLVDADQVAGTHQIIVNPSELNLSSGVYLYKIEVNGVTTFFSKTNKMVLSR